MFFGPEEINSALRRVVSQVACDSCHQEDLLQEALIHLWRLSSRRPGQTPSWYLKSCQLYLLNLIRKGRSIDSLKHRKGRIRLPDATADDCNETDRPSELVVDSDEIVFARVCADDILSSLYRWLDPPDCLVLDHLVNGLSLREIASRLQLSHTAVCKRHRKIASVALSLGVFPSSNARVSTRKIPLRPRPLEPATGQIS